PRPPQKGVLAGDPRLDRKFTVLEQRICLGELLERIGKATGASIQASDRLGPISGYEVTAVVRDQPAWQVMQALQRLHGARMDPWFWRKEQRNRQVAYVLYDSIPPEAIRQARDAFGEAFRRDQRRRLAEFFSLPQEKRDLLAKSDPFLAAGNNP